MLACCLMFGDIAAPSACIKMNDLLDLVTNDDVDSNPPLEIESVICEALSGDVIHHDDETKDGLLECHHDDDAVVAVRKSEVTDPMKSFRSVSMVGKVGHGRHGDATQRAFLTLHMRSQKQLRKQHGTMMQVLKTLKGSSFKKDGKVFRVDAKQKRGGGIVISLAGQGQRGNRYVRKIPFTNFLEASFSKHASSCNVAIAARLDVDPSTVPKLQKTCAAEAMMFQIRMLSVFCQYCKNNPPVSAVK